MHEPPDGPPLLRLALSPGVQRVAVLLEGKQRVLEIMSLLPDGRLSATPPVTQIIEQDVRTLQWVSDEELLMVRRRGETSQFSTYRLDQTCLQHVLTAQLDVPARVLAASTRAGTLEVLLAISTRQGIRFGLFFPQTNSYQLIGDPWAQATFGAWNPQKRLLGVNVALTASAEQLQGMLYRYGSAVDQTQVIALRSVTGQQSLIQAFAGDTHLCLTASTEDGFQFPGSYALETGETCWFKTLGFSAQALGSSGDGSLVLCGGLVEADRRYAIVRVDGALVERIHPEQALLLDLVFCPDARYLLAAYQTPGLAPTLCRYDRQTRDCESVLPHLSLERSPQIQARHWWAKVPDVGRLPVVSFELPTTDHERIVLFLHGGPHLNIMKAYSPLLSRLVEQGFWVVAPNFPGSIGYGTAYEQLIKGDWGGIDVRSVIGLAELLVRQCQGEDRRLVLYGVSYGGYLALLAAGLRPDLWDCVIAGAPISDLQDLYLGANEHMKDILLRELGSLLENETELAARSPIAYTQALSQLPVLLIHGANDTVCPTRQSRRLAEVLTATEAGTTSFEYHELSGLEHELYSERFWVETAMRFLTHHI